jgi:hypothetical protein
MCGGCLENGVRSVLRVKVGVILEISCGLQHLDVWSLITLHKNTKPP